MREEDPLSTSSLLCPNEDPDENNLAAWCVLRPWMNKVDPFCHVEFQHVSSGALRLGRQLTAHVDAAEIARRAAKAESERQERRLRDGPSGLEKLIAEMGRVAAWHRDPMDHVASGW
jgi:hypothetical protein